SVPRNRSHLSASAGSTEKSDRASGSIHTPPVWPCTLDAFSAKPDTKSNSYHSYAKDGSTPMADTEKTPPPSPAAAAALPVLPTPDPGAVLVLNDPVALAERLRVYGESRRILVEWLLGQLVPGIDYTLIHRKVGPRGQKTECPNVGNMVDRTCSECGG